MFPLPQPDPALADIYFYLLLGVLALALGLAAFSLALRHTVKRQTNRLDEILAVSRRNEKRFQTLLQNLTHVPVQGYGPDGTIHFWNKGSEATYGYSAEEALGRNLLDLLVPEETRLEMERAVGRMIETGEVLPPAQLSLLRKDGSRVCVHSSHAVVSFEGFEPELFCVDFDLSERRRAEESLRHRLAMESFIAEFSLRCINLHVNGIDAAVSDALGDIGTLMEVDRSYIFLLNEGRGTLDNTHEWCAPGVEPQKEKLQDIPTGTIPWWMAQLERFQTIQIPRVADLPPEAAREKEILEAQAIQSVLVVPIVWQQTLKGFLGFDSVHREREWTDDDRQILETLTNTFALVFEHQRMEKEREKLQEQFLQSQKMESVGHLAGGVAHDLNNLLSPILGYGELLLHGMSPDDERRRKVEQIIRAGMGARDMVRQLLAFSRRQTLELKPLDLNAVIADFARLLRRTIREDINIEVVSGQSLPAVHADAGQIEQVLMNLALNAQDAMPQGGRLELETGVVQLSDEDKGTHGELKSGVHVVLTATDTGRGMDASVSKHIFEPFFTTKQPGEGTGLGLSTVYGIVKQHGGAIRVYSEPGRGSTFKIYLPAADSGAGPEKSDAYGEIERGSFQTILLVEDNDQVRELTHAVLEAQDYTVLPAANGREALALLDVHGGPVHLLLTDVVMPDMNGRDLFSRVVREHPHVKVVFMSGYPARIISNHGVLDDGVHFIQKPFTFQALATKLREAMESP